MIMVFSKHLYMVILSYILLIIAVAGAGIALVITHTALILGSLLFIFSLSSTIKTGFCQTHPQEKKNAAILKKRLQPSLNLIQF